MPETADLFALVRSFDPLRASGEAPDDSARATALFERTVATPRSSPLRGKSMRSYRLAAIAGAVITLGLIVPAIAVGTGLFNPLDNEPAPPAVTKELNAPAFGLVQITTSTGDTAALYRADTASGDCTYVRITEAVGLEGRPRIGVASCSPRGDEPRAISRFSQTWQRVDGGSLEFALGKVASSVGSVEVAFDGGGVASVPLSHGYFLYELRNAPKAVSIIAKNGEGVVVDRRKIENVRPPAGS